jgi:hypothetical protein
MFSEKGDGKYEVQGRKIDVTADIEAIIVVELEKQRVEIAKKFRLVAKSEGTMGGLP